MASPATNAFVLTKGGSDVEGSKGEEGTGLCDRLVVAGSPFDKLPNELLEHILSLLFEYKPKFSALLLTVNKRFYDLGRPRYFASVDNHRWSSSGIQLILPQAVQLLVRYVNLWISAAESSSSAQYQCVWVSTCRNLTELAIREIRGAVDTFPSALTDTLRSLPHLRRLTFDFSEYWTFEDTDFTFGKDLPLLEELEIDSASNSVLQQLLPQPCPPLRGLSLKYDELAASTYRLFP
ncbi:hypothetical protein JCM8547_008108 [Rhodosporidiobolus lusitaniae]